MIFKDKNLGIRSREKVRFRDRLRNAFRRSKPLSEQVITKEVVNGPVQKKQETLCKGLEEVPSNMIDRKVAINAMFSMARIFEISGAVMVGTFALFSQLGFKNLFAMGFAVGIFTSGALMELGFRLGIRRALNEERESKVEN